MARKGTFSASFTVNGERHWAYGKTKDEARENAKIKKALMEANVKDITSTISVKDWCYEWFNTYKDDIMGSSWHKEIERAIRLRIVPVLGQMQVRNVKPIHIAKLYSANADASESAVKKLVQITRNIFDAAEENELTSRNPAKNVKAPKSKEKVGYRAITDKERELTIKAAKKHPKEGLPFLIMLYCGLRPGEVATIKMKDFNRKEKTLTVNEARKADGSIGPPKTKAGIRTIPVPDPLYDELSKLKKKADEYIVTSPQGRRLTKTSTKRLWHKFKNFMEIENGAKTEKGHIIEKTLPDDLKPYCYRHTYATDLQSAGVDINVAKELLGHSDIRVTGNIYTHKSDVAFENARERINKFHQP